MKRAANENSIIAHNAPPQTQRKPKQMKPIATTSKKARTLWLSLAAILLLIAAIPWVYDHIIPDRVSYFEGEDIPVYLFADAEVQADLACASAADGRSSDTTVQYKLFNLLPVKTVTAEAYERIKVYPGGMPFGVKFFTNGVVVVGFSDVDGVGESVNPAKQAGMRLKDTVTHVDGHELADAKELTDAVEGSGGKPITLTCLRDGKQFDVTVTPVKSESDGHYKTGILVRDSGAGIGTVSFILPESNYFAGLGHGICDADTGELVPIRRGTVVDVTISGINKGVCGTPGEIKGFFTAGKKGTLLGNTDCGVYGILSERPATVCEEPLSIALKDELRAGEAHILCTLDTGSICQYQVEISNINKNATEGKCFNVKVTDPRLLEKTGGIVQGMSGSPIIQNGKLVGAVTHVMINDPTTGYGIFIENMLNAAQMPQARAS